MIKFIAAITIVLLVEPAFPANLPSNIVICKRSDPNLSECIQKALTASFKAFEKGYPDLNIPTLNPLEVKELKLIQSKTNKNFFLGLSYKDTLMHGMTDTEFSDFKADFSNNKLTVSAKGYLKNLKIDGKYEMTGKLILIPLSGKGNVKGEVEGITSDIKIVCEVEKKNGKEYLKIVDAMYNMMDVDKLNFNFDNLVPNNKDLNSRLNSAFNSQVKQLLDVFRPSLNTFYGGIVRDISNDVFGNIPFDEILPP